jgi:hypothetical protein
VSRVRLPIIATTRKLLIVETGDLVEYDEGAEEEGAITTLDVVQGAEIVVTNRDTEDPVPVYDSEDEELATVPMAPEEMVTNSRGRFEGWVNRGLLAVEVTYNGGAQTYVEHFDAVPAKDGSVDSGWLADDAVDTDNIADGAVETAQLANGAVTGDKVDASIKTNVPAGTAGLRRLGTGQYDAAAGNDSRLSNQRTPADLSVTAIKIATGAVVAGKIGASAVGTAELADLAVAAGKLADGAVTDTKLANHGSNNSLRAVGSNHIKDLAVTAAKIAVDSIGPTQLATNAVAPTNIQDDAVTDAKLADHGSNDANRAVGTNHIKDSAVTSAKIADGTIVAGDISGALKPSGSAAGGTEALRALGTTAGTAAAGNDARFTVLASSENPIDGAWIDDDTIGPAKMNPATAFGVNSTTFIVSGGLSQNVWYPVTSNMGLGAGLWLINCSVSSEWASGTTMDVGWGITTSGGTLVGLEARTRQSSAGVQATAFTRIITVASATSYRLSARRKTASGGQITAYAGEAFIQGYRIG